MKFFCWVSAEMREEEFVLLGIEFSWLGREIYTVGIGENENGISESR